MIIYLYLFISQIMSIVFFIDICKEWDSTIGIILGGVFVAEIKGFLWIFFIW